MMSSLLARTVIAYALVFVVPLILPVAFIRLVGLGGVPGLADLMYDEWKTNPLTMVPYPDAPATLKSLSAAGIPLAIVSNTGWNIQSGYAVTGLDAFITTFVLSCDLGIAKPAPEPFLIACERLGAAPGRALMVGNNRLADSGSICAGCQCLILPPVPPGATRGLRAAAAVAGVPWAA